MTLEQLQAVAYLLGIEPQTSQAAEDVLINHMTVDKAAHDHLLSAPSLETAISRIIEAEQQVRAAFICHAPACWEVVVGHHDTHRAPGMIVINIGDEVRLLCARVGVLVRIRVTALPEKTNGYYRGVVLELEETSVRYKKGDGAMFSDDQAVLPKGVRRPRRPIPLGI
ncbi:MAG: hypothetical protein ACTJH7_03440 [Alcaligenes sp.]